MTLRTSREIAADPSSVFVAFEDSARRAAWVSVMHPHNRWRRR
jgi:uncharacterized protein YndB with AHSA1/START domain